jgi:hypothetical protein
LISQWHRKHLFSEKSFLEAFFGTPLTGQTVYNFAIFTHLHHLAMSNQSSPLQPPGYPTFSTITASEPPPPLPLTSLLPPSSIPNLSYGHDGESLEVQFQTQLAVTSSSPILVGGSPSSSSSTTTPLISNQPGFVMFSSGAVLDDKSIAKECGLPFGFLFTPVTPTPPTPPERNEGEDQDPISSSTPISIDSLNRSPARCSNCWVSIYPLPTIPHLMPEDEHLPFPLRIPLNSFLYSLLLLLPLLR